MKLTDIIYSVSSYYRGIENFIRHPFEVLAQQGRRAAQDQLERMEVPIGQSDSRPRAQEQSGREPAITVAAIPSRPQQFLFNPAVVQHQAELSEGDEIRGRWGRYRPVGGVLKVQERVRWYDGRLVLNNKPVLIKEYLLPDRDFSPSEIRERKEKFAFLSNLNLRSSGGQDFRLVNLYEAIASPNSSENGCYLISEPLPHSQTLREYLASTQTMTARQVRHVLNQVLQTLWFLHHQKIRCLNGEVQYGVPHGNLSLDSLLIVPTLPDQAIDAELQFFIYVTDLALWEHLFLPGVHQLPVPAQDLIDLGYVAFHLLMGSPTAASRPNLLLEQPWVSVTDRPLQQFIRQLVRGEFQSNVEEARQTLLNLPWQEAIENAAPPAAPAPASDHAPTQALRQLVILGLLGGCLAGLWWGWRGWAGRSRLPDTAQSLCCLAEVALPSAAITYAAEADSVWSHILRAQNLVAFNRSLEQTLKERHPNLDDYRLQVLEGDAVAAVQSGRADFALTEWRENLPQGLHQEEVAADGLVFLVAFGDAKRTQNIPKALRGKISFEQLQQLYTGAAPDWKIPKPLKDWKIQLYRPTDRVSIEQFEQLVLQDEAAIDRFRALSIPTLSATQMFGEILQDFEQRQTIGIGFARLSQVINQCSVYPLAVAEQEQAVQALAQNQGQPIDPSTDLCGDKGSYRASVAAFTNSTPSPSSYPLKYRLTVVYRSDSQAGRSFAAALKTDEGQALLSAAGLVPLRQRPSP